MEWEEAVEDAIAQFEAQGVDLSNIITDRTRDDVAAGTEHPVTEAVRRLKLIVDAPDPAEQAVMQVDLVRAVRTEMRQADNGAQLAAEAGALPLLETLLAVLVGEAVPAAPELPWAQALHALLRVLAALTSQHGMWQRAAWTRVVGAAIHAPSYSLTWCLQSRLVGQ